MRLNYIALAVPFFTGLMLLEYYFSRRKASGGIFHFREAVANLNVGIVERLSDVFMAGVFYFFFSWLHGHFALFVIEPGGVTWILLFLFTDLLWYWYHRMGHEVNLFWSAHVVHHQSEDFNYTVSARITVFQAAARCLFWSVLPLIGFPAEMITVFLLIHGTYPFFTHTQLVGKLGWLEYVLVTPSHHRVHHSSNPQYLDKNYGDVLIIWDKLFGTFAEEEEEPVYGLTKPLDSHSFLWQHFHFMLEMYIAFRRARGFRQKALILFGRPDHIDARIRPVLERRLSFRQRQGPMPGALQNYIKVQTLLVLAVLFFVILFEHYLSGAKLVLLSLFIIVSAVTTGAMLEQRRWIFHLEFARFGLLSILLLVTYPDMRLGMILMTVATVILAFYKTIGKGYIRRFFPTGFFE
ncbi:MAG: sterol desaturase family protein [Chitinophagaceae bacterium]|nr:sterol desaturase family protein [Chitinophagaceae bacterium]